MRSLAATRTRAMIVLTDGFENTPPMIADVTASLTDHGLAIGFGH
jgi:hypothetical protein